MRGPRTPRGHVARSIAEGKRPFLTCTVAAETFRAIDRIATLLGTSRGRLIDTWAAEAFAREFPVKCPTCPGPVKLTLLAGERGICVRCVAAGEVIPPEAETRA